MSEGERGRLRVYLGAAPGVGKTFAMLNEGHRRAERGTDVVVGLVETHGRAKTAAAIDGLDVVPRRDVDHRGLQVTELDLDAVLARRPEVALVDELAHTIAGGPVSTPAGARSKRWQEVEVLLAHGIDVITTVNVQHLESLNDVVTSITGVRQSEVVPDAVVRAADAVELVDMSPQALRRRMAHGNIYPAEKIDTALARYFREGNLSALRELALLWLADRVDEGLDRYREAHGIDDVWATRERLVVGLSGGAESAALMRRAARIASRTSGSEWHAVYVTRSDGLSGISTEELEALRARTDDLGGTFHAVMAHDVAEGMLDFARGMNATQILIGASRRGRMSTLLRPGIGEVVIAESGEIDVHVVTHDLARTNASARRRRASVGRTRLIWGYLMAVVGTALLAELLELTRGWHGLPTETLLMMAMVIATALVGGLWPAVVAAVVSSLALNLFFVPPLGTLTIAQPENAIAIGIFLLTGVAVATVVDRAARRTEQARKARAEANALAVLSHGLLHSAGRESTLLEQACQMFGMRGTAVLVREADGTERVRSSCGEAPTTTAQADVIVPIADGVTLALAGREVDASELSLLNAYAAHVAVLEERQAALVESAHARELAEADRTRTALLAAVSHDLRSPLAAIKAAVSSLRSDDVQWSAEDEAELLATIEESSDRLNGLVENLLDMSRLRTGTVRPLRADVDLVEVSEQVRAGLAEADRVRFLPVPDGLPSARADHGLCDRVIANVVENALKHTETDVQLAFSAYDDSEGGRWSSLRVIDHGRGVPAGSREALFAPFQRLGDVPKGDGLGLGLAVARGLTEAMGGTLSVEDTPGGGLTMVIDLPAVAVTAAENTPLPELAPEALT